MGTVTVKSIPASAIYIYIDFKSFIGHIMVIPTSVKIDLSAGTVKSISASAIDDK